MNLEETREIARMIKSITRRSVVIKSDNTDKPIFCVGHCSERTWEAIDEVIEGEMGEGIFDRYQFCADAFGGDIVFVETV